MKTLFAVLGALLWFVALITLLGSGTVFGEIMGCITITNGAVLLAAASIMQTIDRAAEGRRAAMAASLPVVNPVGAGSPR